MESEFVMHLDLRVNLKCIKVPHFQNVLNFRLFLNRSGTQFPNPKVNFLFRQNVLQDTPFRMKSSKMVGVALPDELQAYIRTCASL